MSGRSPEKDQEMEVDLYLKPKGGENFLLGDLMKGVVDKTYCIKEHPNLPYEDIPNKWIFAEVTEAPSKFLEKAWQLERAYRHLRKEVDIAAMIIFVNGDKDACETDQVLRPMLLKYTEHLLMKDIPFLVGYTPYRNIYTQLGALKAQLDNMMA